MKHKTTPVEVQADTTGGTFTALASVFGNVDRAGDRVMPGAFADTLTKWRASGRELPVIFSHKWDDIWAHIGSADPHNVQETDQGLVVHGTLDVEDNPVARQAHKLMARGTLTGWSFGYNVKKERKAKDGANELLELDLFEVGPCLVGANPDAQLVAMKSGTYNRRQLDQRLAALGMPTDTPAATKSGELLIARYSVEL